MGNDITILDVLGILENLIECETCRRLLPNDMRFVYTYYSWVEPTNKVVLSENGIGIILLGMPVKHILCHDCASWAPKVFKELTKDWLNKTYGGV